MKTADAKTREQLQGLRSKLQGLRAERSRLQKAVEDARDSFGELDLENAGRVTETSEFKLVEDAVREERTNAQEILDYESAEQVILASLSQNGNANGNGGSAVTPGGLVVPHGRMSTIQALQQSEEYQAAIEGNVFGRSTKFGTLNLMQLPAHAEAGDDPWGSGFPSGPPSPILTSSVGEDPTINQWLTPPDFRGLQPHSLRPLTLYDLVPKGATSSNIIVYVQVLTLPAGFDYYTEGEIKPELTGATFEEASSPVRNLAGWLKISRIAMQDMPFLASLIQSHLPYELRRKLEEEIITGDGQGQHLLGLLNTPNLLSMARQDDEPLTSTILRAITLMRLADENANFVVMNPIDWQNIALHKDQEGGYMFGETFSPFGGSMSNPSIWGLRVVDNRAIEEPLIGDSSAFGLYFREAVAVRTSDSDQDDFVRNMVTILAECRAALVVWRPQAFCTISGHGATNGTGGGNGGETRAALSSGGEARSRRRSSNE